MDFISVRNGNASTVAQETVAFVGLPPALVIHIAMQTVVSILVIPTGLVLGMNKSKWHVPVQTFGILTSSVASIVGRNISGKQQYTTNMHNRTGAIMMILLWVQAMAGVYLKFVQPPNGLHHRLRNIVLRSHRSIGQLTIFLSVLQMINGLTVAGDFCSLQYMSNCATHTLFGLAFLAHGTFWLIIMEKGQSWVKRSGRSIDFYDACHLLAWGVINTFTEHMWGQEWTAEDLEHTAMGIMWWCAGMVFLLQTWKKSSQQHSKRSPLGGVIFVLTGWIFTSHPQVFPMATKFHELLGETIMCLGVVRIIEIALVFKDKDPEEGSINSFQYLTIYLCFASGFMFLGAPAQLLWRVNKAGVMAFTWMTCLNCLAFLYFLLASFLIRLYGSGPRKYAESSIVNIRDELDKEELDFETEGLLACN